MTNRIRPTTGQTRRPLTLMSAFNFNHSDLYANKAGELSKRQIKLAEGNQPNSLVQMIILGHVVALFGVLVVIIVASGMDIGQALPLLVIGGGIIMMPFFYAFSKVTAYEPQTLLPADVDAGEVLSTCGTIDFNEAEPAVTSRRFSVDGVKFVVKREVMQVFEQGASYCIYYTPANKVILSIEVLEN